MCAYGEVMLLSEQLSSPLYYLLLIVHEQIYMCS